MSEPKLCPKCGNPLAKTLQGQLYCQVCMKLRDAKPVPQGGK